MTALPVIGRLALSYPAGAGLPGRHRHSGLPSDGSRYIVEVTLGIPRLTTEGTMAPGYNVRVGDADRDAIAAQLREHYAVGRLTLDELNERLDQTFAAKTTTDLYAVMRDLPHVPQPAPGPLVGSTGPGWDSGSGYSRRSRPFAAFVPVMGLVWAFLILGAVMLFGIGGGDRPLAIVVLLAMLALLKRLFGFGVRRRGRGGGGGSPKGPKGPRGPRGGRGRRFL
jgi:hypothetical protein